MRLCRQCEARIWGNKTRCLSCRWGWKDIQETRAEIVARLTQKAIKRAETARAKQSKAQAKRKAEALARAHLIAEIERKDAERASMPSRLAAIRAAKTERQKQAMGIS